MGVCESCLRRVVVEPFYQRCICILHSIKSVFYFHVLFVHLSKAEAAKKWDESLVKHIHCTYVFPCLRIQTHTMYQETSGGQNCPGLSSNFFQKKVEKNGRN